jgi:hypothetical protein
MIHTPNSTYNASESNKREGYFGSKCIFGGKQLSLSRCWCKEDMSLKYFLTVRIIIIVTYNVLNANALSTNKTRCLLRDGDCPICHHVFPHLTVRV